MNNRRKLLVVLGSSALAPLAALAQSKQVPVVIGWLNTQSRKSRGQTLVAFREGMTALGWKEGSSYVLEERWAEGRYDRLEPLAREIAARKPAIVVGLPTSAAAALVKVLPGTPVVVSGGDPLDAGLVSNLARPGGLVTGISNVVSQLFEKQVELLLDAVPKVRRVGVLGDPQGSTRKRLDAIRRSMAQRPVELVLAEAGSVEAIKPAITRLASEGARALVVSPSPFLSTETRNIVDLALAHRWPTVGGVAQWAEAGALLSYGADSSALARRAAYYVDRILKGIRPGDLPIEQPTQFEVVVNLKTAKALGLTIPQSILVRADRVID